MADLAKEILVFISIIFIAGTLIIIGIRFIIFIVPIVTIITVLYLFLAIIGDD